MDNSKNERKERGVREDNSEGIDTDDCRNCKWFEEGTNINICKNPKAGEMPLPEDMYFKCPMWVRK